MVHDLKREDEKVIMSAHPSTNQEMSLPLMKIFYGLIAVGFLIFIIVAAVLPAQLFVLFGHRPGCRALLGTDAHGQGQMEWAAGRRG